MAVTKIHGIKTTVNKAIEYICNPDKTDQNLYISSFACSPETAALDFKYTLDHTHDCRDPHNTNKASLNTQYVSFKQEIKELELIHQNLSKYLKQDAPEIQRSSHNKLPSL